MNRNNIWIHVGIAVILVSMAAVLGQIDRWRSSLRANSHGPQTEAKPMKLPGLGQRHGVSEVLVRFKPGVTLEQIRRIASANNDALTDEIESVGGLSVIDDLDNADPKAVAAQYAAMTDTVAYAEVNYQIKLDDPIQKQPTEHDNLGTDPELPNDPEFGNQWALNNYGQQNGKERADIDALKAWTKTKGSSDVVVAVLDSGVDYTHVDLRENMWTRPDSVPAYTDDELGTFNDIHGYNGEDKIADPMDDNGHGTHCAGIIGAEGDNGEGIAGIN